jgi:hypothetical protein
MQKQIMAQIELATAPGGFIMPQLAETLGLEEDDLRGGYTVRTAGGEPVAATPETIADIANRLYGIGGAQPAQPAAAAAPPVTVEPGAVTDTTVGPGGIVGQPGISGMLRTPDGRTVVQLEGGGQLDQEQAAAGIEALRARGNPADLALANTLEGAFTERQRPMREGEVRVERAPTTVSTAAQINELGGGTGKITTPEEAETVENIIDQSEEKQQGYVRVNKDGDTIIWDPLQGKWLDLLTKKEKDAIAKAKEAGGEAGVAMIEAIWGDKNPIAKLSAAFGDLTAKIQEENRKRAEEAFKAQE